jgi:hypothetical protein
MKSLSKEIMLEITEHLSAHIANIDVEIQAIKHSFTSAVESQRDSYKPFAVFFTDAETKSFVITTRPIVDSADFYTAISEMLFAFSATESQSMLFAIDVNKEIESQSFDVLEIYMACEDSCTVMSMPYKFNSSNKLEWIEDKANTFTLDRLEKAYDTSGHLHATLEIFEMLYLHTHMRKSFFGFSKLKDYFDDKGFEFVSFIDDTNNID